MLFSRGPSGCKTKRPADGDVKSSTAQIQTLIARAEQQRTVGIIVRLCVDFTPEGKLSSDGEVRQQRNVIKQTQDALLKKMSKFRVTAVKKYEYVPFIAMHVDAAALKFLSGSSLVASIEEDKEVPAAPSAFNLNRTLEQKEPGSTPHEQTSLISNFDLGLNHWLHSSKPIFTS